MPALYYRIDLRIPLEWSVELEKMQKEVYERSGLRVSKSSLVRTMMEKFIKKPSSSCNSNEKKT